jgi:hypothetical protein
MIWKTDARFELNQYAQAWLKIIPLLFSGDAKNHVSVL